MTITAHRALETPPAASLIKPQLRNFSGSGRRMQGVIVERDLEDATAYIGAKAGAGTKHVLVLPARTAGRLAWTSSGRRREALYTPRDLILNPAGLVSAPQWKAPMELLLFAIEPEHLAGAAEAIGARPTLELPDKFHFEDGLLEQLVRTLARQFEGDRLPDLLYTESLTQTLLLHLIRRHSDRPVPSRRGLYFLSEPRVERALEFIQANLSQSLSLAQIASEADLNTSQFCNVFKNVMGLTPHQYVLRQRIEKALNLLKETTLPVSEIALQTGFADQSHLTRVLRQHRGVTPRQVRR
jgi:AraC family transcriptional regulator